MVMQEVSLPRTRFVPYNGKIADITHADTNKHFLDLAAALSETRKIVAVILEWQHTVGVGYVLMYPNEGTEEANWQDTSYQGLIIIKDGTQRVQYNISTANDEWDVYCFGYVVEA